MSLPPNSGHPAHVPVRPLSAFGRRARDFKFGCEFFGEELNAIRTMGRGDGGGRTVTLLAVTVVLARAPMPLCACGRGHCSADTHQAQCRPVWTLAMLANYYRLSELGISDDVRRRDNGTDEKILPCDCYCDAADLCCGCSASGPAAQAASKG